MLDVEPPLPAPPPQPEAARPADPPSVPPPLPPPPVAVAAVAPSLPPHVPEPVPVSEPPRSLPEPLLGAEAAAAATSSVGSLLRTLVAERQQVAVHRGGPTIEDMVREEVRPLLKHWLDTNLPPLVERLVRVEIERLVGRSLT
jgi:cell pole-organizing protein PopZ